MRQDPDSLTITGRGGRAIENRLWRSTGDRLALLFPGWSYGPDAPLLYYCRRALVGAGVSVLAVDYRYSELPEFTEVPGDEQDAWFRADVEAAAAAALETGPWPELALVGKSIGTQAVSHLAALDAFAAAPAACLTPTLGYRPFRDALDPLRGRSLFVIGSADVDHIDHIDRAREIGEVVVIEGADHGLDVDGDVTASLAAIAQAVAAVVDFVATR